MAPTSQPGGREIARAVVTLRQVTRPGPAVNDPPMHNTRHFPAYDGTVPDIFEMVKAGGYDRSVTEIWEGDGDLALGSNTIEDLRAIAPKEIIKGYRFTFAYTVKGGQVLAQHDKEAHR